MKEKQSYVLSDSFIWNTFLCCPFYLSCYWYILNLIVYFLAVLVLLLQDIKIPALTGLISWKEKTIRQRKGRNSLAAQWLGLCDSTARSPGTKIPQAMQCGQKKKKDQEKECNCPRPRLGMRNGIGQRSQVSESGRRRPKRK